MVVENPVGIGNEDLAPVVPGVAILYPVAPNPFTTGNAVARYRLAQESVVEIVVHDAVGRHIATLARGIMPAGFHSVRIESTSLQPGWLRQDRFPLWKLGGTGVNLPSV